MPRARSPASTLPVDGGWAALCAVRAFAAAALLALAATQASRAQSALPNEGYSYMHATLWSMILNCMLSEPNFEWTIIANTLPDVKRFDMGGGLTVLRDAPSLGRSEFHIQTVVDGKGYCLAFSPDATLDDANRFLVLTTQADAPTAYLYREVAAGPGARAFKHRFAEYGVRIESVAVEGAGAGLRLSVSGVSEARLSLLGQGIAQVPRYEPAGPDSTRPYFTDLFGAYCGLGHVDLAVILANIRPAGGTVTPHGAGFVARWDHAPYYVYVQDLTETQPFQCAAAVPGLSLEEIRRAARSAFAGSEERPDPDGPPGTSILELPQGAIASGLVHEPRPGVVTVGRTFVVDGGAGMKLEARQDATRDALSPLQTAILAFKVFCPRTDLRPEGLCAVLADYGTPVRASGPPYDGLVERTTRPAAAPTRPA
jgi:hypothetical protein